MGGNETLLSGPFRFFLMKNPGSEGEGNPGGARPCSHKKEEGRLSEKEKSVRQRGRQDRIEDPQQHRGHCSRTTALPEEAKLLMRLRGERRESMIGPKPPEDLECGNNLSPESCSAHPKMEMPPSASRRKRDPQLRRGERCDAVQEGKGNVHVVRGKGGKYAGESAMQPSRRGNKEKTNKSTGSFLRAGGTTTPRRKTEIFSLLLSPKNEGRVERKKPSHSSEVTTS